jgi:hypothetical protein
LREDALGYIEMKNPNFGECDFFLIYFLFSQPVLVRLIH